jgi:MFS family permease
VSSSFPDQPSQSGSAPSPSTDSGPPIQPLTPTVWLILIIAVIGFAYDTYALLVMPLIARPALGKLLDVDINTTTGTQAVLTWTGYITWSSAVCGGVFGLLGGYLTDRFGRRAVLTWSILLYAVSALASGFATTALALLILRCTTFIGVCVEFIAAVAWLAELFPNPRQRETILGYTQAFSSLGGLFVSQIYYFISQGSQSLPAIYSEHEPWRYALISAVIPAIPLILIRPFLPESPVWRAKRSAGTLKRPGIAQLFQPAFRRTTIVTAALFACSFGAAFGALQMTPQIVPGLEPKLAPLAPQRTQFEAAKLMSKEQNPVKLEKLKSDLDDLKKEAEEHKENETLKSRAELAEKGYKRAVAASKDPSKLKDLEESVEKLEKDREGLVATVQTFQEVGGLVGRFALAWLALRIVSRRRLLWVFQIPGLIIIPLVFLFPGAGKLTTGAESMFSNINMLKAGIFVAGFFTIAQLSYWGNYLPRVYPVHLRGTGEGFAANVGGRMFGTSGQFLATQLGTEILATGLSRTTAIAYAAAAVGFGVYAVGSVLTFFLPEPKEETAE